MKRPRPPEDPLEDDDGSGAVGQTFALRVQAAAGRGRDDRDGRQLEARLRHGHLPQAAVKLPVPLGVPDRFDGRAVRFSARLGLG